MLIPARLTKDVQRRIATRFGAIVIATAALGSCRDAFIHVSGATSRSPSRAKAVTLFSSLGARVTEPLRDPKYDTARIKIANAAMIPSRVWDDSSVWTTGSQFRRTLSVSGRFTAPRYRLDAVRYAPYPSQPAESRHIINLSDLGGDAYAWDTDVQYGIGNISANDVGSFFRALFAVGEGRLEQDVRADYSAVAPRTTAVAGELFTIDSIRTWSSADSSTLAHFAIAMRPDIVEKRLPRFADYVRRYLVTTWMTFAFVDRNGAQYLRIDADHGHITMTVRTRNGEIVSMNGPVVPMPDTMMINGGLTMKVRGFTVGFKQYQPEFTILHTDHEVAWTIISRKEPDWVLPLITERLLRTPLRRPFSGSGALFKIGVRDSVGGPTYLARRMHLEVQESPILRFIGRLGATAVGDYQGKSEREMQTWLRDLFAALVADVAAFNVGG